LENYALGCRFYEAGSLIFMLLTMYTELDGYKARRRDDEQREVKKRELLEQLMYNVGSFVFLVGTFLFDPPIVSTLADKFGILERHVENIAAVMFMIGSFLFSLGSYVNALSIFEAPRPFRRHLLTVTTCYQFGGLSFVAGTMGYVEAFEPNWTMKFSATWMYMVGCFFYVAGTGLSCMRTIASQQVSWERKQARRDARRCRKEMALASLVGNATVSSPRLQGAVAPLKDEHRSPMGPAIADATSAAPVQMPFGDLEAAERKLAEQLETVLGPEAGRELAAALRDRDEGLLAEDDLFGAFWRSVWGEERDADENCSTTAEAPEKLGQGAFKDDLPFI